MGNGKTILLAEDQTDQRDMLTMLLEGSGYTVTTAADGLKALQHLKKRNFDLVLLDIMMPKVDGVKICNKLKHVRSRMRTPVVIISALAEGSAVAADEWKKRTLADAFVAKPYDTRHLLRVIAKLLHEPISETEAEEKRARTAHLNDLKDLLRTKDITGMAKLRATKQEISTQFFRRPGK